MMYIFYFYAILIKFPRQNVGKTQVQQLVHQIYSAEYGDSQC